MTIPRLRQLVIAAATLETADQLGELLGLGEHYKTKNGRTVNEGRGIEPDIVVKKEEPSLIEISLLQKGAVFDFTTEYYAKNRDSDFENIPEGIFEDFKIYLDETGFSFANETEDHLDVIQNDLSEVEGAEMQINQLRKLIEVQKEEELNRSKDFVEKMIWLELKARSGGQSVRTEASLSKDEQLKSAIHLIDNPGKIDSLLSGKN